METGKRKKLLLELATIAPHSVFHIEDRTHYLNFEQIEEVKSCLLTGLNFTQSMNIVDLVIQYKHDGLDVSVSGILKALS